MSTSSISHGSASDASSGMRARTAQRLAAPMFYLTLIYLAIVAGLVVCWIDIPRVVELAETESGVVSVQTGELLVRATSMGQIFVAGLFLLWPLYVMEMLLSWWHARQANHVFRNFRYALLVCLLPPLRLGAVSAVENNQLWLPILGWQERGEHLSRQLQRVMGKPMLVIAFLILPVLALEYLFGATLEKVVWLRIGVHVVTGIIWWCFAAEFIVMVSATDKKFAYVKRNWVDLVIILLPLVSFLRTIRVLRLARLAKVQQITKLTRVYRIKGIAAKASRALLLTPLLNRLLRVTPERRLQKLISTRDQKRTELAELDLRIASMKSELENAVETK